MKLDLLEPAGLSDPVDAIVAAYLDAQDRGVAPARADWLALHAEHAAELGSFLDDLESLSPGHTAATRISEDTRVPSAPSLEPPGVMANPQALDETLGNPAKSALTLTAGVLQNDTFVSPCWPPIRGHRPHRGGPRSRR